MKIKIILSMVILSIYAQAIDTNTTRGLFLDAPMQKQQALGAPHSNNGTIKRFRYIDINSTLLPQSISTSTNAQGVSSAQAQTPQTLLIPLNLFDGTQYMAQITKVSKSSATATTIWSGTIVGMPHSHVSIASTNGVLAGSIRTDNGQFFKIVYSGNDTHMIQEIDELNVPSEIEPLTPTVSSTDTPATAAISSAAIDSGDIIDIMVVYTPAARLAAGGQAAIESIINSSVATMNTTFLNSSIATQVRLVHAEEIVYSRGETGLTTGFGTALDDLTYKTDGYMDTVHALRDTYHADMVQLLFDNSSSGGLAWIMAPASASFESYAFSVVHYSFADGWAFDHEFGHNMGMAHDRLNAGSPGTYTYSYGYQSPTDAWHSIMAYNCVGDCPRIDYWANPAVVYNGESTGIAVGATDEADAHATIMNNLSIIANWRVSPAAAPDLVVSSVTVANTTVTTGKLISLQASVLNQGDALADATTVRYYLSSDITINTNDTELSSASVASLAVAETLVSSVNVRVPTTVGTYYLGACVDVVNSEFLNTNNCSSAVKIIVVLDTDRDGIADSVDTDDDNDGISDILELKYGLNPLNAADGVADFDNDGFNNALEISMGTNFRDASSKGKWVPIFPGDGLIVLLPYL